jgi:hypothetical protein
MIQKFIYMKGQLILKIKNNLYLEAAYLSIKYFFIILLILTGGYLLLELLLLYNISQEVIHHIAFIDILKYLIYRFPFYFTFILVIAGSFSLVLTTLHNTFNNTVELFSLVSYCYNKVINIHMLTLILSIPILFILINSYFISLKQTSDIILEDDIKKTVEISSKLKFQKQKISYLGNGYIIDFDNIIYDPATSEHILLNGVFITNKKQFYYIPKVFIKSGVINIPPLSSLYFIASIEEKKVPPLKVLKLPDNLTWAKQPIVSLQSIPISNLFDLIRYNRTFNISNIFIFFWVGVWLSIFIIIPLLSFVVSKLLVLHFD